MRAFGPKAWPRGWLPNMVAKGLLASSPAAHQIQNILRGAAATVEA